MSSSAYREIGKGQCGSVWAADVPGEACALKRQHAGGDGEHSRSVIKDSVMPQRTERSFNECRTSLELTNLNIPRYHQLVLKEDAQWWATRRGRFPSDLEACNTLISERIPPFEGPVRMKIIELFCPDKIKDVVINSRKDEDCMVRPYLGRRARDSRPSPFFTLRNKALTIDQMENLKLPAVDYACAMADALAFMFWEAKVDANDVEFVLAPKGAHVSSGTWNSEALGEHTLWLLDFDCVKDISMDSSGIAQAASAFFRNDPYFPRPCGETELDLSLWTAFTQRFLRSSERILGDDVLPLLMIGALEEIGRDRKRKARTLA
ncbi:uncharacterized protein MYCGRDRAFT_42301 [Zymoseptoria tritici IPO323]|uniref:DUF3669 domain-containing protein n=1 Tax=Zymoseptoria tritici (strain CBS 115943 / IPO323) TaxID=336722 RepID=F9XC49_ZYMTI|nr:uncharacterized protein MYCGRDRAFT_42301 [Zymoseptoria tritici IPO323]EGP87308.1 hypothetical protein MYCGRDRAFT_42301 [Zymoseptoria tritici IPO323]